MKTTETKKTGAPPPQTHMLPPVVTGQMDIDPDVNAADMGVNAGPADDDAECCIACDVPFEDGDLVYWCSDDTGHLHEECCGPERESYVNADGNPLKDGEPIPKPFAWRAG